MAHRNSLTTALLACIAGAGLSDGIDLGGRDFPEYQPTRAHRSRGQCGVLTDKKIAKRRAANKIARKSRKAHRR